MVQSRSFSWGVHRGEVVDRNKTDALLLRDSPSMKQVSKYCVLCDFWDVQPKTTIINDKKSIGIATSRTPNDADTMTIPRNVVSAEGSPSFLLLAINNVPYDESAPLRLADGDWHGQRVPQIVGVDFLKASKVAIAPMDKVAIFDTSLSQLQRSCSANCSMRCLIGTITMSVAETWSTPIN